MTIQRDSTTPDATPETFRVISPIDESVVGEFAESTAEDVDRAVRAARDAFTVWRETPVR